MSKSLSANDRLKLFGLLSDIPSPQFNGLVIAIAPPAGVVPPPSAPQGDRVYALLQWLGSSLGEDYFDAFLEALEIVAPGKFQPSQPAPTEEPQEPVTPPDTTPKDFQVALGGGVTLEMVYIPGGRFWLGSPDNEPERSESEGPLHKVKVPPFYMGKYPVTQRQWRAVSLLDDVELSLSPSPSRFKGDELPVETVNWHEAVEFCQRLSKLTNSSYRLPSEAEWEYACRAGTDTPFYFGETISTDQANYDGDYTYGTGRKGQYRQKTTKAGSFPPNKFGLYDMHGNVWEWCQDVWHDNYEGAPTDGRAWVTGGNQARRVRRGGSWFNDPRLCRSAYRDLYIAVNRYDSVGFRVCCSAPRAL